MLDHVANGAAAAGRVDARAVKSMFTAAQKLLVAHASDSGLKGQSIENYADAFSKRRIGVPRDSILPGRLGHDAGLLWRPLHDSR